MRHLPLTLAASLAGASVLAAPAMAAEITIAAANPVVELSVYEEVEVEPDIVTIGAGVTSEAPTAVEALRRNSAEMRRVIDLLKALGINARDIQTSQISLNAQYDYNRTTQRQVFRAYQASNRVSVKLRQIERAGEVLDALVGAGATDIFGPSFSIDDDSAAKSVARERALERGKAQAEQYARFAGYSGVRLLQVSESIRNSGGPIARDQIVLTASRAESAPPPPIEPGLVGTGVALQLSFEMVR